MAYLIRNSVCYYPLMLHTPKEERELTKIIFYANGKEIVETKHAWFNQNNNSIGKIIEIGDVTRKNKKDLTLNSVFYIPVPKGNFDTRLKCVLYLPYITKEWKLKKKAMKKIFPKEIDYYDILKSKKWETEVEILNHTKERTSNKVFISQVEKLTKTLGLDSNSINPYTILKRRKKITKMIEEWDKEQNGQK